MKDKKFRVKALTCLAFVILSFIGLVVVPPIYIWTHVNPTSNVNVTILIIILFDIFTLAFWVTLTTTIFHRVFVYPMLTPEQKEEIYRQQVAEAQREQQFLSDLADTVDPFVSSAAIESKRELRRIRQLLEEQKEKQESSEERDS